MWLKLGETQAALDAYQQCQEVLRRLAEADPKDAQAQHDLASSLNNLGDVRLKLGDTKVALDAYQQSLDVRRRLAEADPKNPQAQRDLMISHDKLGKLHEAQSAFAEAANWYDKGLVHMRRWPDPAFFRRPITDFEGWVRLCRAADKALTDPASTQPLPTALRLQVLSAILPPLAKQKQRDKLLLVSELLAKEEKNPAALYDATCAVSLCIPLTDKADDKEKHAVRAVALLKLAIAADYQDRAHMEKDADLEPLRQRADFQKLLQSLPAKSAP